WHDRAGQARRRHRRERESAVRHRRAVERRDRREGRDGGQGRGAGFADAAVERRGQMRAAAGALVLLAGTRAASLQPPSATPPADVPKLALKWAFGFPNGNSAYAQPTIVGGRVFVGADTGFVYALDAATGCVYWSFRANAGVRTAVSLGKGGGSHRYLAYFGDVKANVYAIDADSGEKVWSDRVDAHPVARVTGAPTVVEARVYVPISSLEESGAGTPSYPCCSFRGGVASYDAQSGKRLWT